MRIRTIKPEWLSSQKLAGASDSARVMSVALILMADDHGRGRGSIAEIAMQVWRYEMTREDGAKARETLAKVRETLAELSATGFVTLYQVDGDDFFELPGWSNHQKVDKPGKARIPPASPAPEKVRETPEKVLGTLATDQGSGIRDQGVEKDPAAEWTRPKGLTAIGETIRQAVVEHHEARRVPPPSETRVLTHPRWTAIATWLVDAARLRGWDDDIHKRARALVGAFYASTDPRTVQAKHALAYLEKNPGQYVGLEAA